MEIHPLNPLYKQTQRQSHMIISLDGEKTQNLIISQRVTHLCFLCVFSLENRRQHIGCNNIINTNVLQFIPSIFDPRKLEYDNVR